MTGYKAGKHKDNRSGISRAGLRLTLAAAFMSAAMPAPAASAGRGPTNASIVVNANTGNVIYSRNADAPVYPASTTKLMTAYLTFEALQSGKLRLDQRLTVSRHAASQSPTNLGMMRYSSERYAAGTYRNKKGKTVTRYRTRTVSSQVVTSITVENALRGLLVHSGNDAAVVLAEAIGGSTAGFAAKMNAKAASLGMTQTHFVNPNGLPASSQRTTARDMTKLMGAMIRDYPGYYDQFLDVRHFSYNGNSWNNTNRLLDSSAVPGVDGGKTGYIRASGFNIVLSAKRSDQRVIVGVFGGSSGAARNTLAGNLTNFGFFKIVKDPNATYDPARTYEAVTPPPKPAPAPSISPVQAPLSAPFNSSVTTGGGSIVPDNSYFPLIVPLTPPETQPAAEKTATLQKMSLSTTRVTYRFG